MNTAWSARNKHIMLAGRCSFERLHACRCSIQETGERPAARSLLLSMEQRPKPWSCIAIAPFPPGNASASWPSCLITSSDRPVLQPQVCRYDPKLYCLLYVPCYSNVAVNFKAFDRVYEHHRRGQLRKDWFRSNFSISCEYKNCARSAWLTSMILQFSFSRNSSCTCITSKAFQLL